MWTCNTSKNNYFVNRDEASIIYVVIKLRGTLHTVKTTMAVVAVNIVWPCPSGRSWIDCKARAKAIAPRSPTSPSFIRIWQQKRWTKLKMPQSEINWGQQHKIQPQIVRLLLFLPLYQRAFWCFTGIFLRAGRTKLTKYAQEKTFAALHKLMAKLINDSLI